MNQDNFLNLNANALAYNEQVSPKLNALLQPLFRHLGLTHFAYCRFMQGKRYMGLMVDKSWAEQYFTLGLDKYLTFDKLLIPNKTKKIIIWDLAEDYTLGEYLRKIGYFHGISIHYRHTDMVEGWHFATSQENTQINDFYLNYLDQLEAFITYFRDKAADILYPKNERCYAFYHNNRTFDMSTLEKTLPPPASLKNFLDTVNPKKHLFHLGKKIISLSPSEFETLKGISEGLTAKGIGLKKGISHRTVEVHVQRIKDKFQVNSKSKLLEIFKNSPHWKKGDPP